MLLSGIAPQTLAKIQLWTTRDPEDWPPWYRWDGGWYEFDCENTRYTDWDDLGDDAVIFDIGAYRGEWTYRMIDKYPDCQIYAFEPAPLAFGVAKKRLAEFDNVTIYNLALGATTRMSKLYDIENDGATFRRVDGLGVVDAQIMNISEFVSNEKIGTIALMTINIEGGEFELLPHIVKSGLIQNIERFMIQWHSVVTNSRVRQFAIQDVIAKTHQMMWNHGAWEAWSLKSLLSDL